MNNFIFKGQRNFSSLIYRFEILANQVFCSLNDLQITLFRKFHYQKILRQETPEDLFLS